MRSAFSPLKSFAGVQNSAYESKLHFQNRLLLWPQNLTCLFSPLETQLPKQWPCCAFTFHTRKRGFQHLWTSGPPQGGFASQGTFGDIWGGTFTLPLDGVGMVGMLLASGGLHLGYCWTSYNAQNCPQERIIRRQMAVLLRLRNSVLTKPFERASFIKIVTVALLIWCLNFSTVHWFHTRALESF